MIYYTPFTSKNIIKNKILKYFNIFDKLVVDIVYISTPRTKKSTTQAVTNISTTRGARTKKSTTQSLFTSDSCLSASKIWSCVCLRPAPRAVLFFVRGVDIFYIFKIVL